MIDPELPPEERAERQARIIDALMRRAARQADIGPSRFGAFQSAITLQGQVWEKTRDLERTASELRVEREGRARARQSLAEAIGAMEGGFALFVEGRLDTCNALFRDVAHDLAGRVRPGLPLGEYLSALAESDEVDPVDERSAETLARAADWGGAPEVLTFVVEIGAERFFQISLQRTGSGNVTVLQTDISQTVRQNRSDRRDLLQMQSVYMQAAFEHLDVGVCTFSSAGTALFRNDRFCTLLRLPQVSVRVGTSFEEVLHALDAEGSIAGFSDLQSETWVARLLVGRHVRQRLARSDGAMLDLHAYPLPDRGFMVELRDVTLEVRTTQTLESRVEARTRALTEANTRLTAQAEAQERVEEELRIAKDAAEAAVSSKTRFLAAASHDLLQPISAAKLLISSLAEMTRGSDVSRLVRHLGQSFASIDTLLHALLDISRLDSVERALEPMPVHLGPLLREVARDAQPVALERGVRLKVVPCGATVMSDARYLSRSLRNLVLNAIQYTPPGGRVIAGCRAIGDTVRLEVWDTGIGISKKDQTRIFKEFTRAGNSMPGTGMGLGLSIVERTCKHLGHDLKLRSKPGAGSVFTIAMERASAPVVFVPDTPEDVQPSGDAMDLIALVIENDPDLLFAMTRRLEGWGAGVLHATTIPDALDQIEQIGTAPDVILADYHLDGAETGTEAIRRLRAASGAAVPAVMVTADRTPELEAELREMDVRLMRKPVEPARLRALLERLTEGARDESID